jgi:hypothetical protein
VIRKTERGDVTFMTDIEVIGSDNEDDWDVKTMVSGVNI